MEVEGIDEIADLARGFSQNESASSSLSTVPLEPKRVKALASVWLWSAKSRDTTEAKRVVCRGKAEAPVLR